MAKTLDPKIAGSAREDARALEQRATSAAPYPDGTTVSRPRQPSRMFNVRLSDEQFAHSRQKLYDVTYRSPRWLVPGCSTDSTTNG